MALKHKIDWENVKKLCHLQCTLEEIAGFYGYKNPDSFAKVVKEVHGVTFKEFYQEHRQSGKISLRRAQWTKAVNERNPALLIWLGKQYLKQKDKHELSGPEGLKTFELKYTTGKAEDDE